eukprot:ANDGO_00235.mRNA.1 hypothetical protein Gasu_33860
MTNSITPKFSFLHISPFTSLLWISCFVVLYTCTVVFQQRLCPLAMEQRVCSEGYDSDIMSAIALSVSPREPIMRAVVISAAEIDHAAKNRKVSYLFATFHPQLDQMVSTVQLSTGGKFEHHVQDAVVSHLRRYKNANSAAYCVDAGANIGAVSLRMAAEDLCTIYSFEMQPAVAAKLKLSIALNHWQEKIHLVNAPICADITRQVCFADITGPMNVGGQAGEVAEPTTMNPDENKICLSCQRVDSVLPRGRIRLLKIDVERMEGEVLLSASNLFKDGLVDAIVAELRPSQLELFSWLSARGFEVFRLNGEQVHDPRQHMHGWSNDKFEDFFFRHTGIDYST